MSEPRNLAKRSTTTVRAGMLIPSASVSVANTTFSSPSEKHCSTAWRKAGTRPAWWGATPASRAADQGPYPRVRRSSSARRSTDDSTRARIRIRSSSVVSRTPSCRHCRVASSQAAREKMKVMAGSMPARRRYSITSVRRGARKRWRRGASAPVVEAEAVRVGCAVAEERQHGHPVPPARGHRVVVVQGHRAVRLDHHPGGPPHRRQPPPEVVGVGHRGRQAHERATPGGVSTSTSSHTDPR